MIPFIAAIDIRKHNREFQLWVPLILVWLLMMPIVLVLLPVFLVACWVARLDPLEAMATLWQILAALKGTDVELGWKQSSVLVRLF